MAEVAKQQDPKEYVIAQLRRVHADGYESGAVKACLRVLEPVLRKQLGGDALYSQVAMLVHAGNGDRAIKLVEAASFSSKPAPRMVLLIAIALSVVVGVIAFFLGKT